uniref:Tetratricopeptide repeat protein 39B n=1 Tax=Timema cristinae TaxID=61476 RepID=A0A7R9CC35_TIMCR|nr:unnamed protein product [Timema cristinae]
MNSEGFPAPYDPPPWKQERWVMVDGPSESRWRKAAALQPSGPSSMDLDVAMEEARAAVNFFFNNKFDEAKDILKPWADTSMYHAVGHSVFLFLEAMLTFEAQHIEAASEALRQCVAVCNKYRKKNTITESLGKIVKKANYDHYSPDIESHNPIIWFPDPIEYGYSRLRIPGLRECMTILNSRQWHNENHKVHFESGVRMGIGAFNLQVGLKELETGYKLNRSIRQILCVMTLLSYHLIVVHILSHMEGNLEFCDEILRSQLQMYPDGVWFLFFKGRLEFMKGNIEDSINWYVRSWKSQDMWPQFHHLCFWELMWTNSVKCEWREASTYASRLLEESRWSRTIYSYQRAAFLSMLGDDIEAEEKTEIGNLMRCWGGVGASGGLGVTVEVVREGPSGGVLFDRGCALQGLASLGFAGAAVCIPSRGTADDEDQPMVRVEGYKEGVPAARVSRGESATDGLENMDCGAVQAVGRVVGAAGASAAERYKGRLNSEAQHSDRDVVVKIFDERLIKKTEYDADNRGLVLLLKGVSLRHLHSPLQAEECLKTVISLEKKLKEDNYLVPYALVELAFIYKEQGNVSKAYQILEEAKRNFHATDDDFPEDELEQSADKWGSTQDHRGAYLKVMTREIAVNGFRATLKQNSQQQVSKLRNNHQWMMTEMMMWPNQGKK